MIKVCKEISTDFSKIEIGEAVWMEGHIGVYVGDGLAVECTPKWDNKVQITACNRAVSDYNRRNWTKHGKLPYVTYVAEPAPEPAPAPASSADSPAKEAVVCTTYTVVRGDSLQKLAKAHLGSGDRYPEIKALNGLMYDTLYVGQILRIPEKA